jgi:hypothetical protein
VRLPQLVVSTGHVDVFLSITGADKTREGTVTAAAQKKGSTRRTTNRRPRSTPNKEKGKCKTS